MGRRAFARIMLMMLITGGIFGLPGGEDAEDIYNLVRKEITGVDADVRSEFRNMLYTAGWSPTMIEALESGFVTEMSSYPKIGDDWIRFERIAMASIVPPFGPTVARYAVEDGEDSIEMVELMCRGELLPLKLWIRVLELDSSTMAWLIESELSVGRHKSQTTLDDWYEIGDVTRAARIKPWMRKQLPLPGPPQESYKFR